MKTGPLLVVIEFRPRENQMPEDAPALLKQLDELTQLMGKQPGVSHVNVWASMGGPISIHLAAEVDSTDTAMQLQKNPNPELMALMANLLRRVVVVERRSYLKPQKQRVEEILSHFPR